MNLKTINIFSMIVIIGAVVAMFFFSKECGDGKYEITDTVMVSDTVYVTDTFRQLDTLIVIPAPKIVYVDVPYVFDTVGVLKRYFAHVFRNDTLRNDSSVFIRLEQEITENDVISQILEVMDYEKTKIITNERTITKIEKAPVFYAGGFIGMTQKVPTVGVSFSFMTAKHRIFTGYAGYPGTFIAGFQFPINRLKK